MPIFEDIVRTRFEIAGFQLYAKTTDLAAISAGQMAESLTSAQRASYGAAAGFGILSAVMLVALRRSAQVAGELEQVQIGLTTMTGSADLAQKKLAELQVFARTTPFDFPETVQGARRLLAFGVQADQLIPIMTAMGNAISAAGGDTESFANSLAALGRIAARGKLISRDILSLSAHGVPISQILQEQGLIKQKDLSNIGRLNISSEKFFKAFIAGSAQRFGGAMEAQSKTLTGSLSNLRDAFYQLEATIGTPLLAPLSAVTRWLTNLIVVANKIPGIGQVLATAMIGGAVASAYYAFQLARNTRELIRNAAALVNNAAAARTAAAGQAAAAAATAAAAGGGLGGAGSVFARANPAAVAAVVGGGGSVLARTNTAFSSRYTGFMAMGMGSANARAMATSTLSQQAVVANAARFQREVVAYQSMGMSEAAAMRAAMGAATLRGDPMYAVQGPAIPPSAATSSAAAAATTTARAGRLAGLGGRMRGLMGTTMGRLGVAGLAFAGAEAARSFAGEGQGAGAVTARLGARAAEGGALGAFLAPETLGLSILVGSVLGTLEGAIEEAMNKSVASKQESGNQLLQQQLAELQKGNEQRAEQLRQLKAFREGTIDVKTGPHSIRNLLAPGHVLKALAHHV